MKTEEVQKVVSLLRKQSSLAVEELNIMGFKYSQGDREYQETCIQELLERDVDITVVNLPVVKSIDQENILMKTYKVDSEHPFVIPSDTKSLFFYQWMELPDLKGLDRSELVRFSTCNKKVEVEDNFKVQIN